MEGSGSSWVVGLCGQLSVRVDDRDVVPELPGRQGRLLLAYLVVNRARAFLGYSGWGPSQLDAELERDDWILADFAPEDAFTDDAGRRLLSRAAVSEITDRLWAEYEAFTTRDLSEHRIVYLFIDGIAERLRAGQPREPVMAAWGIGAEGSKVLLHLMAGSKEDTETVRAFFQDMRGRGLGDPLIVVSDGAPGIIRAIEECFPRSARQRCLAHRMRNLAVKVPTDLWPEFKARATACYQAPSRAIARDLANGIRADYASVLPSAIACFEDDFEACIAHLRLPVTHRRATRTTNLLERLFVEERRRLKIIPNGFGEKPVLKLMFAALIRAAERWRGLRFTEFELRQIAAVRKDLDTEYEATIARSDRRAQTRFSSTSQP